jgi:hypothetical protein
VRHNQGTIAQVLATLDPLAWEPIVPSDQEFGDLLMSLHTLTSTSLASLPLVIPDAVPSGLSVDRLPFP